MLRTSRSRSIVLCTALLCVACASNSPRSADAAAALDTGSDAARDAGAPLDGVASAAVGSACATDGDCAGGTCITAYPGGYCTRLDCATPGCPPGSTCVALAGAMTACLLDCTSPSDCRTTEGYTCDADGTCYPAP